MRGVVAVKVIVFPGTKLTCDLYCHELVMEEDGLERMLTEQELKELRNGYRIVVLKERE